MAQLEISLESDIARLARFTGQLSKEMRTSVAKAMTHGARQAEKAVKAQSPRKIDRPTRWTMNSVFVAPAKPSQLRVAVGFKDYAVKGTPAAKYLEPIVSGGDRQAKGAENLLRRTQVIPPSSFIVPTGVTPLKLDQYGNIGGSRMVQVLSRLKSLREAGSTGNVTGSKRSQGKRSQRDYFTGRPGNLPFGIYARIGRKPKGNSAEGRPMTVGLPRGFHTVFYVTRQAPRYRVSFQADKILAGAFTTNYQSELARLLTRAMGGGG